MEKTRVVARCGDSQNAPESTLPAFEQAIAKGAHAIELDAHLTKDRKLIVHHDYYLARTDNGQGYIGDFTLAELKALDAGSWFGTGFIGEKMPTLGEVLELGKGKTCFEIDMKSSSLTFLELLTDELARFDVLDQVELTSAHIPLLFHAKRMSPRVRTGMFFHQLPEWMRPELGQEHILDWMALSNTQVAHLHSSLLEKDFVARLWKGGFLVHGSNLNSEDEIERGVTLGIDQFSTDRLALALSRVNSGS